MTSTRTSQPARLIPSAAICALAFARQAHPREWSTAPPLTRAMRGAFAALRFALREREPISWELRRRVVPRRQP